MEVFLYGDENLVWIYRLDEIVGYLASDGLIHDVFFLALGNHYHGRLGMTLFDDSEGLEAGEAGHILVEYDEVEWLGVGHVESVAAVVGCDYIITLVAQKHQVGFEEVDLIVGPKYPLFVHTAKLVFSSLNSNSGASGPRLKIRSRMLSFDKKP